MKLQDILEDLKMQGNYAVSLYYGEGMGADDLDISQEERRIQIVMSPMGYLGGVRKLLVTNLKDLETVDLNQKPKLISNPPKAEEYQKNGLYIWGEEKYIKEFL